MTKDQPKLVKVVWEDITVVDDGTWVDRSTPQKAETFVFRSVGWLLEHTSKQIVLAMCLGDTLMSPREVIPTGVIKSITLLSEGRPVPIRPRRKKS